MPVQPTKAQEQAAQQIYFFAADLMRSGEAEPAIISALMKKGLDRPTAARVIENLKLAQAAAKRKKALRDMLIGAGLFVIGMLITFTSYATETGRTGNGTYLVALGAIILGAADFARGIHRLRKS
jgi:hypothetical protein